MTVLMNYKRTVEDFKRCGSKSPTVYGLPYVSDCVGSNVDRCVTAFSYVPYLSQRLTVFAYQCMQVNVVSGPKAPRAVRRRQLPLRLHLLPAGKLCDSLPLRSLIVL